MTDKAFLAEMWKFPWPVMDVLIGGNSSIDLPELKLSGWDEATEFLRAYGYDPDRPADLRLMHAVVVEAIAFIETVLITPREWEKGIRPPDEVLMCEDPRQLLMWASSLSPAERASRYWSCAILRVMHTIAHLEGVNRYISVAAARQQIMARFQKYIFRDEDKQLWFGLGPHRVKLARLEWKDKKTRRSIILKLLHKKDNVAETIYDYLGVRFVTTRLCDVMMVVKYLRQFHIVSFPNCYPSRSRNNLIDTTRFRTQVETLRDMLTAGSISPTEFETMVARLTAPAVVTASQNPHSSQSYHSVQLTCRQLVTMPNPQFAWLDKLEQQLLTAQLPKDTMQELKELRALVGGWHAVRDDRDVTAFYPFEIQIMDADSHDQANSGTAAHGRYKTSQVRAARKRVLLKVLELSR